MIVKNSNVKIRESENILSLSLPSLSLNPLPRDNHCFNCKTGRGFSTLWVIVPNFKAMTTCTCAEEAIIIINTLHVESSLCAEHCRKHFCMHSFFNMHSIPIGWQRQDSNPGIWLQGLGWTWLIPPPCVSSPASCRPHLASHCLFLALQSNP